MRNRKVLVAVLAVTALIAAGGAIAYYLAQGSGAGNGKVAQGAPAPGTQTVTVNLSDSGVALAPGDSAAFNFTVDNATGSAVHVGGIAADPTFTGVGDYAGGIGLPNESGCSASWFSLSNLVLAGDFGGGVTIPPNGSVSGTGTVSFNESGTDQSGCEGQEVDAGLVTTP